MLFFLRQQLLHGSFCAASRVPSASLSFCSDCSSPHFAWPWRFVPIAFGPGHWYSRLTSGCVALLRHVPHKPGSIYPLSNPHARPVEGGGLNSSPELAAYTPASPNPSSTEEFVLAPRLVLLPPVVTGAPCGPRQRGFPLECLVRVVWKDRIEARSFTFTGRTAPPLATATSP